LIRKKVLIDLLNKHLSTQKIAGMLGRSQKTVLYWERKYGLSPAFAAYGNGRRTRSLKEMADRMRQEPTVHRRRLKAMAIAYKGGKCLLCGYHRCNAALEFHHLDKTTKGFGLSRKGIIRSWESIKKELDKCVMICANCHREVEAGVRPIGIEPPKEQN
jgi:predicted transcriptional regulator